MVAERTTSWKQLFLSGECGLTTSAFASVYSGSKAVRPQEILSPTFVLLKHAKAS